jgi:predicted regulator of Ras-like GTPase activity (Roadblock/LC7/MglB family)
MEPQTMSVVASGQGGITNQDDLQAIFLTEETLTPERIVELCGGFPGISSCVLSRGAGVIAAHNVPDSIDLVSLSAHALEMIRAMRESSAKMGVGAVPAVTLHSEKGPITFFHEDDVCFLVLHKDRGFVPGVREKLQQVVHYLAQARLPKPVSQPSRILEG